MKRAVGLLIGLAMIISLVSCGNDAGETVPKSEYDTVVSMLNDTEDKMNQLQTELKNIVNELEALKIAIQEEENQEIEVQTETVMEEKEEEGFTVATEPITVPDPATQSEFVVEVTAENFMSIFEFKTSNLYNSWGEYWTKEWGFSSLLYEQGWALGKIEGFAVEYSVFGEGKTTETQPTAGKVTGYSKYAEDAEPELRVYRAKGTLIFYPIKDVKDRVRVSEIYDVRYIIRTLPDGTEKNLYTDYAGTIVY